MKKLNAAVKLYLECLTISGMRPLIVYIWGIGFVVTYYYSHEFIERKGWKLIKG